MLSGTWSKSATKLTTRSQLLQRCSFDLDYNVFLSSTVDFSAINSAVIAKIPSPILVTGSSGLLGSALVQVLQLHGKVVRGLDIHPFHTTNILADVENFDAVRRAVKGVKAVFHTAALHAPDSDQFDDGDFWRVNVTGTENVLAASEEEGVPVVHTSTTSLMISHAAKDTMKKNCCWFDRFTDAIPRNKYGITKLESEILCRGRSIPVVILRPSRFYANECQTSRPYPSSTHANERANELLGRRVALEDCLEAHLLAMEKIEALRNETLIVSAPVTFDRNFRLTKETLIEKFPQMVRLYQKMNWELPQPDRVYDSVDTVKMLDWNPKWTFEKLLQKLDNNNERAQMGCF